MCVCICAVLAFMVSCVVVSGGVSDVRCVVVVVEDCLLFQSGWRFLCGEQV